MKLLQKFDTKFFETQCIISAMTACLWHSVLFLHTRYNVPLSYGTVPRMESSINFAKVSTSSHVIVRRLWSTSPWAYNHTLLYMVGLLLGCKVIVVEVV